MNGAANGQVHVPEGFWHRESSENPEPISPMGEVFLDAMSTSARHLVGELGLLVETIEWRSLGGWVYLRAVPFAGDEKQLAERIGRGVDAVANDLGARYLDRWEQEWRPWLRRRSAELDAVDMSGLDPQALDDHLEAIVSFLYAATDVHVLLHASNALLLGELAFACRDLLGWSDAQTMDLVSGSSSASTDPARSLAALAALARNRPALRDALAEPQRALKRMTEVDADFAAAVAEYLAEFGGRAIRYEVIDPTLGERPDLLLQLIADQIEVGFDPRAVDARVQQTQQAARAQARAALAGKTPEERDWFGRTLERAVRFYPVREDNEVWTTSVPLGLFRRVLLEVGRRLAGSGSLASGEGVFLLHLDEARSALTGSITDCRDLVAGRLATRAHAVANPGPSSYGDPPPDPDLSGLPADSRRVHELWAWLMACIVAPEAVSRRQDGSVLQGIPASAGVVTGPVRVVRTEDDLDRLRPGEVLVCHAPSPVWSVVFATPVALVTDTGGLLSHFAIIAREFGIPAVVGTGHAAALLRDGQVVTVDGDRGRVEVMS